MKKLISLLMVFGILFSMAGCVTEIDVDDVKDRSIAFFEDVESLIPYSIKSHLETTTIGTMEDKDIFDFEDCDWDKQQYYTPGTYSIRSDKGWVINMTMSKSPASYYLSIPPYMYVGHGNHKLYDEMYGQNGYLTPSCLRIQSYSGNMNSVSSYLSDATHTGNIKVSSPIFIMKENYVTTYMLYNSWITNTLYYTSIGGYPKCDVVVSLIDATSATTVAQQTYLIEDLENVKYRWMPIILNGAPYKGRTMFIQMEVTYDSGACMKSSPVYGTYYMTGKTYDVYFDEIHFSDEYGDYITYIPSVPPTPNYSYVITDKTVSTNGTLSTDNGNIIEYQWLWGDGRQSFEAIQTHTYSADGNYTCQLCVTDDEDMTVCISKVLNINTTPESNTIIEGTTTPQNSTSSTVTQTTSTSNTTSSTSTSTTNASVNKPFPILGFIITLLLVGGGIVIALTLTKKNKKKIIRIGKSKGGRKK